MNRAERRRADKETPETSQLRIAIVSPVKDDVKTDFAHDWGRLLAYSSLALVGTDQATLVPMLHKGTILDSQRNEIVNRAGIAGCTHILWLDSDMTFPKDTLVRLLAHGKPIVGANYVTRRLPTRPVAFKEIRGANGFTRCYTNPDSTGLEEVHSVGFGCVLTEIGLFPPIPMPWFETRWRDDFAGFEGEDVSFCRKVREQLGLSIYVDHDLSKEIGHVGVFEYRHEHGAVMRDEALTLDQASQQRASRIVPAHAPEPPRATPLLVEP